MSAYKQDEQHRSLDGAGWRPDASARRVPEPVAKPSRLGAATAALRTSRRVRLLAALALIAVCVLAVPVLALSLTPKPAQALAAAVDLPPGTTVTAADLKSVSASGPAAALVPAAQESAIVGQTVRVEVPAGALMNEADLGAFPPIGSTVVPVAVKPGEYPTGLQAGSTVAVFPVANGTTATQAISQHAAATGTVIEISPVAGDGSNEVVVDLQVAESAAAVVAQAPAVVLVGLDARADAP